MPDKLYRFRISTRRTVSGPVAICEMVERWPEGIGPYANYANGAVYDKELLEVKDEEPEVVEVTPVEG